MFTPTPVFRGLVALEKTGRTDNDTGNEDRTADQVTDEAELVFEALGDTTDIQRGGDIRHHDDGGSQYHARSEEHTSELQSLMRISYAVFCLKKTTTYTKKST